MESGTGPALESPVPDGSSRHLDRAMARGLAWTGGARWAAQIVTWFATIALARLLAPADFGIWAMASVYHGIITLLSEFGVGASVVMLRKLDDDQIAQVNGFAVLLGIVSVGFTLLVARPVGWILRSDLLPPVIAALSIVFLVNAVRTVPLSLLQKDLHFKKIALVDASRALIQSATLVTFAALGFRYWTLVIGALVADSFSTIAYLQLRRHAIAWPRMRSIRRAMSFSMDVVAARLAWYLYSNSDVMIGGRLLGKDPIGAYSMAWTLASVPVEKVSSLVVTVTPAFFSAVQTDLAAIRRYVLTLTSGVALITFPAAVGLSLVARDFVPVVLGPGWDQAIVPMQLLAVYTTVRSVSPILVPVLYATGESRFVMWNSVTALLILPAAFVTGARYGPGGLAAAWLVAHPFVMLLMYRKTFRHIELASRDYLRCLVPSLGGIALMSVLVLITRAATPTLQPAARLFLEVAVGGLTYTAYLFGFHRERIRALRRLVQLVKSPAR